jgi:D-sedoheptulose 7-phosphate isomerase
VNGPRFFENYFAELSQRLRDAPSDQLEALCRMLVAVRERRGKVILAGNGASAAMASHVAVDLTKIARLRAVTFNEVDLITCFANDYGYENWIAKAIEFYADANDLVLLISSSGASPNIVAAAQYAVQCGLDLVTLSGFSADNPLRALGNLSLWVNSRSYNIVETTHQLWLLAALDLIATGEVAPC